MNGSFRDSGMLAAMAPRGTAPLGPALVRPQAAIAAPAQTWKQRPGDAKASDEGMKVHWTPDGTDVSGTAFSMRSMKEASRACFARSLCLAEAEVSAEGAS